MLTTSEAASSSWAAATSSTTCGPSTGRDVMPDSIGRTASTTLRAPFGASVPHDVSSLQSYSDSIERSRHPTISSPMPESRRGGRGEAAKKMLRREGTPTAAADDLLCPRCRLSAGPRGLRPPALPDPAESRRKTLIPENDSYPNVFAVRIRTFPAEIGSGQADDGPRLAKRSIEHGEKGMDRRRLLEEI